MATEAQIAANRANALLSTGPRTPEGKARSAQNALRHGNLARAVLTRAECRQRFNEFVAGFHVEYRPATATEVALVDALATARWRAMRMSNFEAVQIDLAFDAQHDPALEHLDNDVRTGIAYGDAAGRSGIMGSIGRAEARLQHQFNSAFDRLARLIARRNESRRPHPERLEPPAADSPANPISWHANQHIPDNLTSIDRV
ncbi:MAG: hypothetical protein ABSB15_20275 [Bryobacteraceae bacterium]|jgi:hypothetical protein